MPKLNGGEIIIESLKKENVDVVFGYPGGAVINLYDALYNSKMKHYLGRHEQGVIHAADGYARSSGKVGVCIATSGPGGTNLVTGLANAQMDSIPLVAFTGQVSSSLIGKDAFQEADITGISLPVTKHNFLVTDIKDLARTIKEAFYIARTGRPGPVLIDLAKDVTQAVAEFDYPDQVNLPGYRPTFEGHKLQINKAAKAINEAKKPLLYVGGGAVISGAQSEIRQMVEKAKIPITTTLMALGIYPEDQDLALEMLGMHGTQYANKATLETDLLIAVGARFDDRVTGKLDEFAAQADIIQIDIDPAEIGKNLDVEVPIVGDVKKVLKELLPYIKEKENGEWQQRIKELKEKYPLQYEADESETIKPQYIMEEIDKYTKGDATIVTEVGQHQMWAAQFHKYKKPRQFITSGGLGTMGYGLPAAIGAQIGQPEEKVVLIAGDGSIQMNIQELGTAQAYNIPVKIIIFNNKYLGMVRQWQEFFFDKRYSSTKIPAPDFVKMGDAYGIWSKSIDQKSELDTALKEAMEHNGPAILDVHIPEEENVYPMVPAGAGLKDMIGG
ncbi:acetolactate synthase large subunit [Halanaerobium saccharolyticum]|uniref:Acetolactate synthase n=1 Tax=Halanaerobium saccharolyticum TaxID=43595 RepID=A0A4R7Z7P7_9FIRM|nr:biosynthetic-type acetolactate synthase large subunit [Halanaerobium saccharolyticum]RAK11028.1 acetolactate synthase large subunit [Halanaerobium saccharolyticum]TDW06879.1 acetolactate synthase large subunit [Halanaerobium saccharolyticum]TDX63644.1 acetolactate synthase large subunit [Halanaerobium saccharolyticum]